MRHNHGDPSYSDLAEPKVPPDHKVYAVGDIHGRFDLLCRLSEKIRKDALRSPESRKIVIFLGDYVDRGPRSRQVLEFLTKDPFADFETVFLRGNHEDFLLKIMESAPQSMSRAWLMQGGLEMLKSYGAKSKDLTRALASSVEARAVLLDLLPPLHRDFLEDLTLTYEVGDYFFAHAGIRPGVPLDMQKSEDLMWIRGRFLHSDVNHGKIIVHGHTVSETPQRRRNRIGIDTGAFRTGILTALVLFDKNQKFMTS